MSLSEDGDVVTFLDLDGKPEVERGIQSELVAVEVSLMGKTHFVVEEKQFRGSISDDCGDEVVESGLSPEKLMVEIYQHFANPRSPGGDRSRRQCRREKERLARRKWDSQHFVMIVNCSPTPERPLQASGSHDQDVEIVISAVWSSLRPATFAALSGFGAL
ncbi:hypothetical protein DEO72_LG10g2054 [Vigna unguiculata]|nr:hypothetical protein DEO72_LG10g2054 [Vigna unguiculata]